MSFIQRAIELAWRDSFLTILPNQRFFTPLDIFWEELSKFEKVSFVDCGAGNGQLMSEAKNKGILMSGCDLYSRDDVEWGLVKIIPAHKIPFNQEVLALVCRPDHGGWCEDLVMTVLDKGSSFIYVGLPENVSIDIPVDIEYMVLAECVGEDGEMMLLITKGDNYEH